MYCEKCGNKLGEGAAFCGNCGAKVGGGQPAPAAKKFISSTCECCGAKLKKLGPNDYICEYCGTQYHTADNGVVTETKLTEKELLDVFYRAADFEVKNRSREELQCLLEVFEKVDDNAVYFVKLGRAYRRNNMFAKAMECYEKAKAINPNYAPIYTNIGAVYILSNQHARAEEPCKKGVELLNQNRMEYSNSDFATAYANLAVAVGKQGRKEEAKRYLRIAEQNGYKNGDAARKMIGIKKGFFS